jgi:hypothetical protein
MHRIIVRSERSSGISAFKSLSRILSEQRRAFGDIAPFLIAFWRAHAIRASPPIWVRFESS